MRVPVPQDTYQLPADTTAGGVKTELSDARGRIFYTWYNQRVLCVRLKPDGIQTVRLTTNTARWEPEQPLLLPNMTEIRIMREEELVLFLRYHHVRLRLIFRDYGLDNLFDLHL